MKLQYLNYKEPLTPVENGHGYLGTLAQTENKEEVQCHICGKLFENLGIHVWSAHQMKARDYRVKFNLGLRTPLCSDAFSDRYREINAAAWSKMTEEEKEARRESMRQAQQKARRIGNPTTLEIQNKRGMCPDQLIERICEVSEKLGKSPSFDEFIDYYNGKYMGAIQRTFGSWTGAKRMAGLQPCKTGPDVPHNRSHYTNEQLLEFLKSAHKEKGKLPTFSDFKRGFLPSYYLYQKRFGGIHKARELAGIQ